MPWWFHPESETYFQASYADMEASMKNGSADAALCSELDEKDVPQEFKKENQMPRCSICSEPQFKSLLGMNCANGHLNAPPQESVTLVGSQTHDNVMLARVAVGEDMEPEQTKSIVENSAPQIPVDKLVKIYVKIRDALSAEKKKFDAIEADYKGQMAMVATELKARAQAEGVDGFKTEFGTVYLSETMKTSCADWGVFGEFLKTHDPLEFMEKRISSTAVKEYMKQNEGQLPPGVSVFREIEARVRRAGEK